MSHSFPKILYQRADGMYITTGEPINEPHVRGTFILSPESIPTKDISQILNENVHKDGCIMTAEYPYILRIRDEENINRAIIPIPDNSSVIFAPRFLKKWHITVDVPSSWTDIYGKLYERDEEYTNVLSIA